MAKSSSSSASRRRSSIVSASAALRLSSSAATALPADETADIGDAEAAPLSDGYMLALDMVKVYGALLLPHRRDGQERAMKLSAPAGNLGKGSADLTSSFVHPYFRPDRDTLRPPTSLPC